MTTQPNASPPAPAEAKPVVAKEPPRYLLTEPAFIDNQLFDQAMVDAKKAIIHFDGIPGPHMHPLNESAKAMVAKHKPKKVDPVESLTVVGPGATVLKPHDVPGTPGS
jgi:hypothetical protein